MVNFKSIFNQKNSVIVGTWIFMFFNIVLFISVIGLDVNLNKYELTFVGLTFTTIIPLIFLLIGIKSKNSFNLLIFKILFYVYLVIVAVFVVLVDYSYGTIYLMINEKENIDVIREQLMEEYQTEIIDGEDINDFKFSCFVHILNITILGFLVLIYFIDSQNYVSKILKENETIKAYREFIFTKKNKISGIAPIFNSDMADYGRQYGVNNDSCIIDIIDSKTINKNNKNTEKKCSKPEEQTQNKNNNNK